MWLSVLPVKALGMKFAPPEFSMLLRWWLGISVLCETPCPEAGCPEKLDPLGDHAVMCACGPSRISRHDSVNWTWARELKSAGFHVSIEQHVDPDSNRRSADTLVDNWDHGAQCAQDWVITHTLQHSAVTKRTLDPNMAVKNAEAYKNSYAKDCCNAVGVDFLPLATDTFGGFGELARQAIKKVASQARLCRGADERLTGGRLLQRLQVSVMKGVARQLLRRITHEDEGDGSDEEDGEE
jgi:hypothetical protein